MNCPVCESRNLKTIKTERHETCVFRERYCKDCNTHFDTTESTTHVQVLNGKVRRKEHIELKRFNSEGWKDVVLDLKKHPSQINIFDKKQ